MASSNLLSQNFDSEDEDDDFNPAPAGGSDDEVNGDAPSDNEQSRDTSAPRTLKRGDSDNQRNGLNGKRARAGEAEEEDIEEEDAAARQSEEDAEGGGELLEDDDDEDEAEDDDEEAVSVSPNVLSMIGWLTDPLLSLGPTTKTKEKRSQCFLRRRS